MIKAVIFDLDGTLMDTLADLHTAVCRALAAFGLPPVTLEKVRLSVGNGVSKLVERCLPPDRLCIHKDVLSRFNAEYAICGKCSTKPFEGVCEILVKLKKEGIKTAVVSNKTESAVKSLCADNFPHLIDLAVGDNGVRKLKPDPQPVNYAMQMLGVEKNETVYVGDQEVDIETSVNADVKLLAAGWGFRGREALEKAGAEIICAAPGEILRYLE